MQLTCNGGWFNKGICGGIYGGRHVDGGEVGDANAGDGGCAYMLTGGP